MANVPENGRGYKYSEMSTEALNNIQTLLLREIYRRSIVPNVYLSKQLDKVNTELFKRQVGVNHAAIDTGLCDTFSH